MLTSFNKLNMSGCVLPDNVSHTTWGYAYHSMGTPDLEYGIETGRDSLRMKMFDLSKRNNIDKQYRSNKSDDILELFNIFLTTKPCATVCFVNNMIMYVSFSLIVFTIVS